MQRDLRIVFMGTPEFAVASLKQLIEERFNVVGVITAPDKPAGRGRKMQMSPVKQYALSMNIPVLQPTNLKSPEFLEALDALQHNLQVVVAFRMLPEVVFERPQFGCFNLHASLLPQYRGAAPIHWAVINGEKQTGVTTFFLKKKIDTGNILLQESINISAQETTGELYYRLMQLGAELVIKTCQIIQKGEEDPKPQITEGVTLKAAPKIFKEDCEINWHQDSQSVFNFIRGMSPYPCAWTTLQDKLFKIYYGRINKEQPLKQPGSLLTDGKHYLMFATKDGWIDCQDVQLQGKKRLAIQEFLNGFTID